MRLVPPHLTHETDDEWPESVISQRFRAVFHNLNRGSDWGSSLAIPEPHTAIHRASSNNVSEWRVRNTKNPVRMATHGGLDRLRVAVPKSSGGIARTGHEVAAGVWRELGCQNSGPVSTDGPRRPRHRTHLEDGPGGENQCKGVLCGFDSGLEH
ncbi:hypothetical protein OGATHE_004337 [Ogataea polymorpha]|uniref:Uncharacterized protein n=1 Tax=Ogataea polymorpha TaxID=460523 RepID=A0A9P8T1P8_9ASCO|nr:hypothetical protein OGATHE_004337 [Ogataea polymorpha]